VTATATTEMRAAAHTTGVTAAKVTAPAKVTAAMSTATMATTTMATTTMATATMATASAASGVGCTRKCDRKNNHGQNFEF
jgi:hypothetical protein